MGINSWNIKSQINPQFIVLMQSLMGETTAVAHGGNPDEQLHR
ncbi:hypothetical protein [Moorena sp. SIO3F7]|nr:hypothetical protein [Moorena sp. SIO3F7]